MAASYAPRQISPAAAPDKMRATKGTKITKNAIGTAGTCTGTFGHVRAPLQNVFAHECNHLLLWSARRIKLTGKDHKEGHIKQPETALYRNASSSHTVKNGFCYTNSRIPC